MDDEHRFDIDLENKKLNSTGIPAIASAIGFGIIAFGFIVGFCGRFLGIW